MRTTVRLPEELLERAKRKATADGTTLTSLIEKGLELVLAEKANRKAVRRVTLPRISRSTGGLLPGIDPLKINVETEEADDLARLRALGRPT